MLDECRSALPGQTVWDREDKASVKGLHLRVSTGGVKSFYLFYRPRTGGQRRFKIGEFGETSLSEARNRAKKILDRVAVGEDPKAHWTEKREEMSVSELFEKTWNEYWNKPRYQNSGWAKQVKWSWERHVKVAFGSWKLSDITPAKVRAWHAAVGEISIYNANQALKILSRMFRFAEEQEIRDQHSNPCNLVKSFPEKERDRYATDQEIQKIVPLLEANAKKSPHAVAFLYLLMFSGSRPRAIERATWEDLKEFEVNGQKYGILTFDGKTTKTTGQKEKVVLPPQAMRVVSWLPRIEGMTICGIKMPRTLWRKIKKEAGCPDLWARDWRRTFATVGLSNGVDMWAIGEVLNHQSTDTTKIYAKLVDQRRLETTTAIADRIQNIALKESTG